jgi:hypothetical protein
MAQVRLAIFDSDGKQHLITSNNNHSNLAVVDDLADRRDNQLLRIVAQESGAKRRETLFFVSIKENASGRAELVITAKDRQGQEVTKSVVGKWWDEHINKSELKPQE